MRSAFFLFAFFLFSEVAQAQEKRTFLMGFSPWPYDFSIEAVEWTYKTLNLYGDVVSHHIEEGVPWEEALRNEPFPIAYEQDLQYRLRAVDKSKKVILQLNPLDIQRANLAPRRGDKANEKLQGHWRDRNLDDPDVKQAYLNYVLRMNDIFKPDYFFTGVEVNLLMRKNPDNWKSYVNLQCYVYNEVKKLKPSQKIYVSLFVVSFFPEWVSEDELADHLRAIKDLRPCVDGFGLSVHPFMSAIKADSFPNNYFDRAMDLIPAVVGITESSYPAQEWTLMFMTWKGTQQKQDHFLQKMLEAAGKHNMKFVIWYAPRDYDAMWEGALNKDSLALIWRDTGLFDEAADPRQAFETWKKFLDRPCVGCN